MFPPLPREGERQTRVGWGYNLHHLHLFHPHDRNMFLFQVGRFLIAQLRKEVVRRLFYQIKGWG